MHCTGENSCFVLFDYLRSAGEVPYFNGGLNCLIFDENAYNGKPPGSFESERISEFCGVSDSMPRIRNPIFVGSFFSCFFLFCAYIKRSFS